MTSKGCSMKESKVAWVVAAVLVGGCGSFTKPNPLSCLDGYCSDQAHPFCDVDGTFGGEPKECVAVSCLPLGFEACRGDAAIVCNATGDDYDVTNCPFGCDTDGCKACTPGAPGCAAHIIPKYLPAACDRPALAGELKVEADTMLSTDDDSTCNGGVASQPEGSEICVIRYASIVVARNRSLTIRGSRAVALVADEAMTVDGVLDISADWTVDGPGGGLSVSGGTGTPPVGSGGAGFKTSGGAGGTNTSGGALNGGPASPDPAQLSILVGGPHGTNKGPYGSIGGGAGGAATLISCKGSVSIPGLIDAGGGGGSGGSNEPLGGPAAGGGAGGYVVLQGMMVEVTGQMFANGCGGGVSLASGYGRENSG